MPTHDDTPADRTVTLGIDGRRHILRTTQDRRHSLEVRAWALASGHRLPERGRIPLAVLRDYAAAHPQETPGASP